jgi:hypothetical protein
VDDEDGELLKLRERKEARTLLQGIPRRRAELAESERVLVWNARKVGIGWGEIAAETKMSAGWMAYEKYGEPVAESGDVEPAERLVPDRAFSAQQAASAWKASTLSKSQTTNGRDSLEKNKAPRSANTPPGPHGHNGCRAIDVTAYPN